MQEHLVTCDNLLKIYKVDDLEVVALQGLDLEVSRGEMIALVGASGSGKTTLMNILGGLDTPSAGRCSVADYDLTRLSEEQRTRYRNLVVGYLWQQSGRNLLPDLTVAANIDLPQMLNDVPASRSAARTRELLALVGLAHMAGKRPFQLSGGEQQRVAIAVALANQPEILLADEPTGEVDSLTARELIALLRQINTDLGQTIILVTHDTAVAERVDRTLAIRDGRTSSETIRRQPVASVATPVSAPVPALDEPEQAGQISSDEYSQSGATSSIIGLSLDSHRELVLVDRVGRLQLPPEALKVIPVNGRAEVQVADDRVILWPFAAAERRERASLVHVQGDILGEDGVQ